MRTLRIIAAAAFAVSSLFGHFYTNGFDGPLAAEWVTNWRYSIEGLTVDPNLAATSVAWTNGAGKLRISGDPYSNHAIVGTMYNGFMIGNAARLNRTFNASSVRPFGFEVIRSRAVLNADTTQAPSPKERTQCQLDIWMMQDDGTVIDHRDFYPNYLLFYENAMRGPNSVPRNRSTVGLYDGTYLPVNLTNATNAIGYAAQLTNTNVHTIDYPYQWRGDVTHVIPYTFENSNIINGSAKKWNDIAGFTSNIVSNGTPNPALSGNCSLRYSNNTAGQTTAYAWLQDIDMQGRTNVTVSFKFASSNYSALPDSNFIAQYRISNTGSWIDIATNTNLYPQYTEVVNYPLDPAVGTSATVSLRFLMTNSSNNTTYFLDDVSFSSASSSNALYIDQSDDESYWMPGPNQTNTNAYGIRMVHDGSYISLYINPDPDDNDAYPNEYLLVARRQVLWSNNISLMLGHEVMNYRIHAQEAEYDSVRIVSAADSSTLFVTPTNIMPSTNSVVLRLMISNIIDATNAGINYIEFEKPADLVWANADPSNCIVVSNGYLGALTNVWIDPLGDYPSVGQAALRTNGNRITVILSNMVTNNLGGSANNEHIYVYLTVRMSNEAFTTAAFSASVEGRHFQRMSNTWGNSSTCGIERCTGSAVLAVQKRPASGYFSIAPDGLPQDTFATSDPQFIMKIKAVESAGYDDIKEVAILVPNIFTNCTFSNFNSSRLGTDITNYIRYYTNITGLSNTKSSNLIFISFPASKIIQSPNGRDEITFTVHNTPQTNTNYSDPTLEWTCWLDGATVSSASVSNRAQTNADFLNQAVRVSIGSNNFWDVYIPEVKNISPPQAVLQQEIPLYQFTAYRDGRIAGTNEYITGITITNMSTASQFLGTFSVYTNDVDADHFSNSVRISSNTVVSNLNGSVVISNLLITMTNIPESPTKVFLTYTPLSFDPLATNRFQISYITATGPDGGMVGNSNLFSAAPVSNIKLDDNTVIAVVDSVISNQQRQGTRAAALRINLKTLDQDAVFTLTSLNFTLQSTTITNQSEFSLSVYRDTGTVPGSFDAADTPVTGSDGVFVSGSKYAALGSSITIDKNDNYLFAVVTLNPDAQTGAQFSITMPKTGQNGFQPFGVSITNDGLTSASGVCTVMPAIAYTANDAVAVARTMIRPALGERVAFHLDDTMVSDVSLYRVYIYDVSGVKVQEISFTSYVAYWDARSIAGSVVRSGIYIAVVKGPGTYSKKIKLMVVK